MIQVNVGDHRSVYPGWAAFPRAHRHAIMWARERACWIARSIPTADAYFRRLPFQRTLSSILKDGSQWINFEDSTKRYGATEPLQRREVCISTLSFNEGRWMVLATLIHELAHVAGAMGFDHSAEQAVMECGLGRRSELIKLKDDRTTPYAPGIHG